MPSIRVTHRPPNHSDAPPPLVAETFAIAEVQLGEVRCYFRAPGTVEESTSGAAPLVLIHSVNAAASAFEIRPLFEHYSASRRTYAIDLPGFGLSDRSERAYSPRLMTDAVLALTNHVRRRHPGERVDGLAVSLGCEFLARAAVEDPGAFRSLALVSPTGFSGRRRLDGPPGSTREVPGLHSVLSWRLWADGLYRLLTRPAVIRYFLRRTFGRKEIDEALWEYDVHLARQGGAKHAPLYFLSGALFSNDISRVYDRLDLPVWLSHGVRGDFVDFRRADAMRAMSNWSFSRFDSGALPYFERLNEFVGAYDAFLDQVSERSAARSPR